MSILWIGLSIFAVVITSFFIIKVVTKNAFLLLRGQDEGPLHSNWIPLQVYSGEDSLDHPDLKRMFELAELEDNKLVKGGSRKHLTTEVSWASVDIGGE
jgi:hypothetical protein